MNRNMKITNWAKYFLIAAVGVAAVTTAYVLIVAKWVGFAESAGTFGDQFGGLSAIFSGLAFVALIVTILMQKEELELQRRDLETQAARLSEQIWVDAFYSLLSLLREIRNYDEVKDALARIKKSAFLGDVTEVRDLSPLFKCVKAILSHIDSAQISKDFYIDVLIASLSFHERKMFASYADKFKSSNLSVLLRKLHIEETRLGVGEGEIFKHPHLASPSRGRDCSAAMRWAARNGDVKRRGEGEIA